MRVTRNVIIVSLVVLAMGSQGVRGESRRVAAGEALELSADLVLAAGDSLEVAGTGEKPGAIVGNGHQIRTAENWTGRISMAHCRISRLGTGALKPEFLAIDVRAAGEAAVVIEDCVFEESAGVAVYNGGNSTCAFRRNTIAASSVVPVSKDIGDSRTCFSGRGPSKAAKFFQGNRVLRAHAEFDSPNWMIGGDTDAESNLFVGLRVKVKAGGAGTVIRGNYLHVLMPRTAQYPYWSQVSTVDAGPALLEHNVIRDGEWIVQMFEGEVRYNLICDINDHNTMRNGSAGRVHHNIFHTGKPDHPPGSMGGFIFLVYPPKTAGGGMEIYNNTFDGCGTFGPPGVEINEKAFAKSVRNNVFCNMRLGTFGKLPPAVVRGHFSETVAANTDRLGYADYNLFHNPESKGAARYGLTVEGKTLGKEAGFGLHDLTGEPKFKGPLSTEFPFKDEEILAGRVTVSQMLAYFRERYSPGEGSPLIDAGDPADGEGVDVGAVGAGKGHEGDRFGKLGVAGRGDAR